MTDAPDMKPEMTEWDRKFVSQPNLRMPTIVYKHPARNATCMSAIARHELWLCCLFEFK